MTKSRQIAYFITGTYIVFVLGFFFLALWRYSTLRSVWAFDLGYYNRVFWQVIHGRAFAVRDIFRADHFTPVRIMLVPFYFIFPGIPTILFLQSAIVSLGGIACYFLGKHNTGSRFFGVFCLFSFFLTPGVMDLCLNDYHSFPLSIPFILFAFYFYQRLQWGRFLIFFLLALSCREEIFSIFFIFGILVLFEKRMSLRLRLRWSGAIIAISIFWGLLYLCYKQFLPPASESIGAGSVGGFFELASLYWDKVRSGVSMVIANPGLTLRYSYRMSSLLLFLCLLQPYYLISCLHALIFFWSLGFWDTLDHPILFDPHYFSFILAFIFITYILSLAGVYNFLTSKARSIKAKIVLRWAKYLAVTAILVALGFHLSTHLRVLFSIEAPYTQEELVKVHELAGRAGDEDVVLVPYTLSALFSSRREMYCYEQLTRDWDYVLGNVRYAIIEKKAEDVAERMLSVSGLVLLSETDNLMFFSSR